MIRGIKSVHREIGIAIQYHYATSLYIAHDVIQPYFMLYDMYKAMFILHLVDRNDTSFIHDTRTTVIIYETM